MKILASGVFVLLFVISCNMKRSDQPHLSVQVIPVPKSMVHHVESVFTIDKNTKLVIDESNEEIATIAKMFVAKFKVASGISLTVEQLDKTGKNVIIFTLKGADPSSGREGYELEIDESSVTVKAPEPAGLFYGMQSLLQLLPAEIESPVKLEQVKWVLPSVSIKDAPRFGWRGLHLDAGRHIMPLNFIKKYLDNMAMHKLNTFHWHLTDDQGWRIEIKQYPKLTEVGAWRKETLDGHYRQRPIKFDGIKYGGYYTQEEIKEIIQYARERFITIVPEIELPGHASAAITAYPELGVTGKQIEVATTWGIFPDIFNVEDATFTFLENVLSEVMELFPGKYIHIGGDEAIKDQWKASRRIQQKIKELGLKDEHELQSYFITRIEKFVNSKGRQIIGWDEILEGGLAPNAAVMSWRGVEGGIAAAKSKHYVVMSPVSHMYFDYYQGNRMFEPLAIGGNTPLEKVYAYEPVPDVLTGEEAKYILGAQANVWTEYMKTPEYIEYMVFPRVSALSEVLWSAKENKNWEDFKSRLPKQLKRYDYKGINYSKTIFKVDYSENYDSTTHVLTVKLHNQLGNPNIYYTIDGNDPDETSKPYEQPISIDTTITIKAATIIEGQIMGGITEKTLPETKK